MWRPKKKKREKNRGQEREDRVRNEGKRKRP